MYKYKKILIHYNLILISSIYIAAKFSPLTSQYIEICHICGKIFVLYYVLPRFPKDFKIYSEVLLVSQNRRVEHDKHTQA